MMKAYTDYPFSFLGDLPGKRAPVRQCLVTSYDGDKYCRIVIDGHKSEVKAGYLYQEAGRNGDVPMIDVNALPIVNN